MLLSRDQNHGDYEIRSYTPGEIKVNDTAYNQSILVTSHTLEVWSPQTLAELLPDDFDPILMLNPEVVLIGTGESPVFLPDSVLHVFFERQIGVEVMSTAAACRTFNVLMSEERNVAAALLIR